MTPRAIAWGIACSLLATACMATDKVEKTTIPPNILEQYTSRGISASAIQKGIENGIYPDVKKYPVPADVSAFKQPASLVKAMKAIQTGTLEQRLEALKAKVLDDLVFVKGGTFLMGDFGPLQSKEHLPWDNKSNSSPLHKVTLTSYSISKYKVTRAEADLYAEANHVPKMDAKNKSSLDLLSRKLSPPSSAISVTWHQAKEYCAWLTELTGQPFALPTEAQWEYAARSRGKFILYATNDGTYSMNVNVPTSDFAKRLSKPWQGVHLPLPFSIALFKANPIGIYDLAGPGSYEWVNDWYTSEYYSQSGNISDPMGPAQGTEKVLRAGGASYSSTIHRYHGAPDETSPTFRCALNTQNPQP